MFAHSLYGVFAVLPPIPGEEGAKHRAPLALRRMTRAAICCHSAYGEKIRRHVSATQTKAFPPAGLFAGWRRGAAWLSHLRWPMMWKR